MSLSSLLYQLGRTATKAGSVTSDVKNIANGSPEKVIEKAVKREIHKGVNSALNSILRGKW